MNPSPLATPWEPPGPLQKNSEIWSGLPLTAASIAIAAFARQNSGWTIVVAETVSEARQFQDEISYFSRDTQKPVFTFPDWEILAYDAFSPHEDIISQRLKWMSQLGHLPQGILIIALDTLLHRLAPRSYIHARSFYLKVGQNLDKMQLLRQLENAGYRSVSQVYTHGEYASRGSIIDLYPMGSTQPYRMDLLDTEIDSIRNFDPETQLSIAKIDLIDILPAREFALDETSLQHFRRQWRECFPGDPMRSSFYKSIQNGIAQSGAEYYLPLFHEKMETLFDYIDKDAYFFLPQNYEALSKTHYAQWEDRYQSRSQDSTRPVLTPAQLFLNANEFTALLNHRKSKLHYLNAVSEPLLFDVRTVAPLSLLHDRSAPLTPIMEHLSAHQDRILICAQTAGRAQFTQDFFAKHGHPIPQLPNIDAFLKTEVPIAITVASVYDNFSCPALALTLLSEASLWGQKLTAKRETRAEKRFSDDFRNLADLPLGAPVVHLDHGIGRFEGLVVLDAGGQKAEYLLLSYDHNDKLYVPVSCLHLISRYSGSPAEDIPLAHLGSAQWQKAKEKALAKARDTAAELLDLYAKRSALKGYHFELDEFEYAEFSQGFAFDETEDQKSAIEAVIRDMKADTPMDRLVCGDVGFGKTEVAIRAAFIAVMNKKQVAILVPTTLLAEQHYETFLDRFSAWPVKIAVLSRFQSAKAQKIILEELNVGKIDILIGTHKLLQPSIQFQHLGLVIIDEEHRFGVRQKENLKNLRAEVDVLTLTATPIPRTLNMAISDLRQLSIIGTPPPRRLAIKTFLHEYEHNIVREAILREIHRGGQVYFLHNDVSQIERITRELQALVPEAQCRIAHGQLHERELEQIMADFHHQRFNVLVCTTIIETGIDISTTNTIIINQADRFGLAQLHQLRGRVGRSHHQAYAYLLVHHLEGISEDAKRRLEAITAYDALGVGFILATHDLEIRGAGELLGDDQSGQIQSIGLTLYADLLERAVKSLQNGESLEAWGSTTEIKLNLPTLIPETYLPDIHERLVLYKRIASALNDSELDELKIEMIDRFGLLPEPSQNLFALTALKLKAKALGVQRIDANEHNGKIEFSSKPKIDPLKLIRLIQTQPHAFKLENGQILKFYVKLEKSVERIDWLARLLEDLQESE